ncbi:MAG: hypothetical protein RQ743_02760 [Bacteroidales bacterium]|nr:hypothetical protein [Bacteroidales bacterium]
MTEGNKMKIPGIILILLMFCMAGLEGQEKTVQAELGGYLNNMQTFIFEKPEGDWITDNLIHNRLNFSLYAGSRFSFALEVRNRFFTGDMLSMDPTYADRLASDDGLLDLTANIFSESSFILNSRIDRLWADLSLGPVQMRAGRQRINWGQTLIWNPNDIFNAYSYFDVDYPERPGSDAIRLQIYPDYSSTIELVAAIDSDEDITFAGLYRFNKWAYDIQFLAGLAESEDIVFGAGWSGAFGSTSFRGEISWFQPAENFSDITGTGLFTIGLDRGFSGSGMMQLQLMYCNKPYSFEAFDDFYSGKLSAKDLAFSEFSLFGSISYPVSPLFNLGLSAIWYPDLDGFYAGPSADISLAENLDFSFIWQHFNAELSNERTRINLCFIRMKYSF